jgi:type 1 glutamine amidotransferase
MAATLALCAVSAHGADKPLRVLIVSGGGFHNYPQQRQLLEAGLKARLRVEVTQAFYDPKGDDQPTRPNLPVLSNPGYGDGFDVIIHNECAADESDPARLANVLAPHRKGTPAVNLHCAMHSYRSGAWREAVKPGADNANWFAFTGIQSTGHGPQSPVQLAVASPVHPIAKGLPAWTTPDEELYNNVSDFGVTPVLTGSQPQAKDGRSVTVAWTHTYGPAKARVFGLTLAHNETTMADPRYLDLVARGVAWASGHLKADGTFDSVIKAPK